MLYRLLVPSIGLIVISELFELLHARLTGFLRSQYMRYIFFRIHGLIQIYMYVCIYIYILSLLHIACQFSFLGY